MVEHDVLALEGRRLKGSLVAASQDIAGLENRKAQLRFSMEERKQEIQVSPMTIVHHAVSTVRPVVHSLQQVGRGCLVTTSGTVSTITKLLPCSKRSYKLF